LTVHPPLPIPFSFSSLLNPHPPHYISLSFSLSVQASPNFVKNAMKRAMDENANQYCRSAGLPSLVQSLAKRYERFLQRPINWETEVTIGVGATETLFATMQSLIDEGDEAILISPSFDIYAAQVQMAGGVCRYVPLSLVPDNEQTNSGKQVWKLDMTELRRAFNDKTKLILLNTPHNPTGKMFSRAELEQIAAILQDYPRVVAVADEVYEFMTYDGREHVRLATLPGMWDRTLTVSSSGKTFSVTGWKIGWAVGPEHLIRGLILTNQWVQFSVSTPAQHAIALCLEEADKPYEGYESYYAWLRAQYERKKSILMNGLVQAGLSPVAPDGGFFIIADTSAIQVPDSYMQITTKAAPIMRRDWAFCRYLTTEHKVAAIPPSAFYEGMYMCVERKIEGVC
jgi:kynurenine--oxoglutarate transaminase/cysteine-S-conjugate beta-lyase/glutamine--phenylpyruvate transaminase